MITLLLYWGNCTGSPWSRGLFLKILFFTFKALNNLCPSYISDLLETYKPTRSLRSSSRNLLVIPRSKLKSYGDRAFSVSAPKLWNDIPETIKCSVDLNAFKRNLKTYLFKRYFYEWLRLIIIFIFLLWLWSALELLDRALYKLSFIYLFMNHPRPNPTKCSG